MRMVGMSVPDAVREVVTKNRSIYDCMKMDVINYTALAVRIQPEIERILGNKVNLNTVVVAIKRFADSFEVKEDIDDEPVLKNARLSLIDGIMDIKLPLDFGTDPSYLMNKFSQITSDYEFFRLPGNFRLLTDDLEDIRNLFNSLPNSESFFRTGLAKIKILIPDDNTRSDAISYVAEILHSNGIELVNAFFSQENIIIVLNEIEASKAYEILRSEIAR